MLASARHYSTPLIRAQHVLPRIIDLREDKPNSNTFTAKSPSRRNKAVYTVKIDATGFPFRGKCNCPAGSTGSACDHMYAMAFEVETFMDQRWQEKQHHKVWTLAESLGAEEPLGVA
jgi:hypothetical protein